LPASSPLPTLERLMINQIMIIDSDQINLSSSRIGLAAFGRSLQLGVCKTKFTALQLISARFS
jgi:hypothetical protein